MTGFRGYAFIIGAMKAGTTSLYTLLQKHPAITTPTMCGNKDSLKEPEFFGPPGCFTASDYEAIFGKLDKTRHAFTLDGSTGYSKGGQMVSAPQQIAALPGEKKLIYILRDPIDRIASHLSHQQAMRGEFALRDVINVSAYAKHLDAYEAAGLRENILLIDFRALRDKPGDVLATTQDFMGIERRPSRLWFKRNVRPLRQSVMTPEMAETAIHQLRNDTRKMIEKYGFEPAKSWKTA